MRRPVIEVSADSGTVTLRGTVDSFRQKREGSKAAARVRGVIRVANELQVRIPGRDQALPASTTPPSWLRTMLVMRGPI